MEIFAIFPSEMRLGAIASIADSTWSLELFQNVRRATSAGPEKRVAGGSKRFGKIQKGDNTLWKPRVVRFVFVVPRLEDTKGFKKASKGSKWTFPNLWISDAESKLQLCCQVSDYKVPRLSYTQEISSPNNLDFRNRLCASYSSGARLNVWLVASPRNSGTSPYTRLPHT